MTLHLGQASVRGSLTRYSRFFDLLEVSGDPGRLPRPAVLKRWRESVPSSFAFSLTVPGGAGGGGQPLDSFLAPLLLSAEVLDAEWLVLKSDRTLTPTSRNRERLAELAVALRASGRRVAWRADGLWEPDEARELAGRLGVCWVVDIGRDEPPERDYVYGILRSLGSGGVVSTGMLERAAERLGDRGDACIVLEGRGAGRAATQLRQLVAELHGEFLTDLDEYEERQKATHES